MPLLAESLAGSKGCPAWCEKMARGCALMFQVGDSVCFVLVERVRLFVCLFVCLLVCLFVCFC